MKCIFCGMSIEDKVSRSDVEDGLRWWEQLYGIGSYFTWIKVELCCSYWTLEAMAATSCQTNWVCLILKRNTDLLVHFPHSSSTRLLLRFHSSSWHDPLVRVPTAAHQYHLPGGKAVIAIAPAEVSLAKNMPVARTGLESHSTTANRMCGEPQHSGWTWGVKRLLLVLRCLLMSSKFLKIWQ